ncbi:hypothetical protein HPB50_005872 [Hyalomma asiaticum]|uniref:Uncharacterized protein n=1 Tax=Hyalomma asiaticum TaxID=266040 RepID=A0ACB7S4Y5_HYAAI|nr:hypothetical protein HPB50_005872 [Hyalomma asiaticum]
MRYEFVLNKSKVMAQTPLRSYCTAAAPEKKIHSSKRWTLFSIDFFLASSRASFSVNDFNRRQCKVRDGRGQRSPNDAFEKNKEKKKKVSSVCGSQVVGKPSRGPPTRSVRWLRLKEAPRSRADGPIEPCDHGAKSPLAAT